MKIIQTADCKLSQDCTSVIAVGCFDGVHRGHRLLIETAHGIAATENRLCVVLTFEPHPAKLLRGVDVPLLLTREEKTAAIAALGTDVYVGYPFTKDFANWPPAQFFTDLLARLQCRVLVIGEDFRFGKHGEGTVITAKELGTLHGIDVQVVPPLCENGEKISSTHIRKLLAEGKRTEAEALLS